jgi:hypothetical protein
VGDVRALPWITDPSKTLDAQPNIALIAELEGMLAMAKAGDLMGIAYATDHADGSYGWGWCSEDITGLVGGVAMLDFRIKSRESEKRTEFEFEAPC